MSQRLPPYWKATRWSVRSRKHPLLPETPTQNHHISLCTACMGRADDLKLTLLQNIADNTDYPCLEFLILNYNSDDDLHDYMHSPELRPFLRCGRLTYMRTREPRYFSPSHARNVALRNGRGDIVMNVDADNFTGAGFASYINRLANAAPSMPIFAKGKRRIHGRIGLFKADFERLGGYDEDLVGYGGEDHSLLLRAMAAGFTLMWWAGSPVDFLRRIITPKDRATAHIPCSDWRATELHNRLVTLEKLRRGQHSANAGREWGVTADLETFSPERWS